MKPAASVFAVWVAKLWWEWLGPGDDSGQIRVFALHSRDAPGSALPAFGSALVLFALLLGTGLYTVVTRRNAIAILMGVELILNAAILNLVAFSRYGSGDLAGQVLGLFGIVLAASEAIVALAIVIQLYRTLHSIDTSSAAELKR